MHTNKIELSFGLRVLNILVVNVDIVIEQWFYDRVVMFFKKKKTLIIDCFFNSHHYQRC